MPLECKVCSPLLLLHGNQANDPSARIIAGLSPSRKKCPFLNQARQFIALIMAGLPPCRCIRPFCFHIIVPSSCTSVGGVSAIFNMTMGFIMEHLTPRVCRNLQHEHKTQTGVLKIGDTSAVINVPARCVPKRYATGHNQRRLARVTSASDAFVEPLQRAILQNSCRFVSISIIATVQTPGSKPKRTNNRRLVTFTMQGAVAHPQPRAVWPYFRRWCCCHQTTKSPQIHSPSWFESRLLHREHYKRETCAGRLMEMGDRFSRETVSVYAPEPPSCVAVRKQVRWLRAISNHCPICKPLQRPVAGN